MHTKRRRCPRGNEISDHNEMREWIELVVDSDLFDSMVVANFQLAL